LIAPAASSMARSSSRAPTDRKPDLVKLDANGAEMRSIRGGEIGLVFQEPMTSFSPVHTIGAQLVEAIRLHNDVSKQEARRRGIEALRSVGIPSPSAESTSTRSS
jgi:ABC-type microcin C transport system duplicated ATPase subunit YejF